MAALFRFHGELADLLTVPCRRGEVSFSVKRRASVKDVFESMGVPHTEVHRILVQGRETGFGHLVAEGDPVDLYPGEPPVDPVADSPLRPGLSSVRFLVDENVGRLAMLLRLIGHDAAYDRTWDDKTIADQAWEQGRIVLSRDRALLKRSRVVHGRLVRAVLPRDQLVEVVRFYGLVRRNGDFPRCLRCNAELEPVAKERILHRLLPKTRKYYHEFSRCPQCGRIYWAGSHHAEMARFVEGLAIPAK